MKIKKIASMLLALTLTTTALTACGDSDKDSSSKDSGKDSTTTTTTAPEATTTTPAPEDSKEPDADKDAPEVTNNDPTVDGKFGHVSLIWADGVDSYYWKAEEFKGIDPNSNWLPIEKNGDYTITAKVWNMAEGVTDEDFIEVSDLKVFALDWAISEDLKDSEDISINTTSVKLGDTEVTEFDFAEVAATLKDKSLNDFANNWEGTDDSLALRQNLYNEWGGNLFAFDYGDIDYPEYNYITVNFTIAGLAE